MFISKIKNKHIKRYEIVDGIEVTTQVDYPDDAALVFDVETLVMNRNCPVIAVAASATAWFDLFLIFI